MQLSGKKMGSIKALKESLKKGGSSSGTYIKNVPAEGITVRFLTEPEEWFGFHEYWNDEGKTFVPMAQGEVLPDGSRPSFRYLTQAVDIATDRVIPLKLAKTAANSLILKYDKFGTILDRNYELQKHGEGLDTTYDVTPDAPSKLNLAKYETLDLEKILIEARASALGENEQSASSPSVDDDEVDDDDDDDDLAPPTVISSAAPKKKLVVAGKSPTLAPPSITYEQIFPKNPNGEEIVREDYTQKELIECANTQRDWLKEIADAWNIEWDSEDEGYGVVESVLEAQANMKRMTSRGTTKESDSSLDADTLSGMKLRDLRIIADSLDIDHEDMTKEQLITAIIEQK